MQHIIHTIMGTLGSAGFAVLFGVYDLKLIVIALGRGTGWVTYLLCIGMGYGKVASLFAASLFVSALSELLARIMKTPVILLLVPMLVPEMPGGDLYYTMHHLVQGQYPEFGIYANQVMAEAGALAIGIILASFFFKLGQQCKAALTNMLLHKGKAD